MSGGPPRAYDPRELRPTGHLRTMGRRWGKEIWRVLWKMREAGQAEPSEDWPPWCFMPMRITRAIVRKVPVKPAASYPGEDMGKTDAPLLGALAAWRATQGVYRFDWDVFTAVWDTPLSGGIPVGILKRMPEWCAYVETPGASVPLWGQMAGFFACLDPGEPGRPETLWLVVDFEEQPGRPALLLPFAVPLDARTVEDAAARLRRDAERAGILDERLERRLLGGETVVDPESREENVREIQALVGELVRPISLLVYLCSETAEYADAAGSGRAPSRPEPRRTRRGPRLFPPAKPTVWETGYRMGAALRRAREARGSGDETGRGTGPRPHYRRAHYHSFWTGPKNRPEERSLVVRWLPPMWVKMDDPEDLVPVVRPVD